MKLSKETIEVLQNFSTINKSILIIPGKTQKTISPLKTGYAEVVLAEEFPKECALFDLPVFLGILSLFKEPEIEFGDTHVIVKELHRTATYRYCNPSLIVHPPKDKTIGVGEIVNSFQLEADDLKLIMKAVNLYGFENICIEADGTKIKMKTLNVKEKDSDGMSYDIADTDQRFKYVINVDNMKLLQHSYDISITKTMSVVFQSKNMPIKYFVSCDAQYSK